jgi:hypothetical protein
LIGDLIDSIEGIINILYLVLILGVIIIPIGTETRCGWIGYGIIRMEME